MKEYLQIGQNIRNQVVKYGDKEALFYRLKKGVWKGMSWRDFGKQIDRVAVALLKFGVTVQENVGIFAQNMPQWMIADIGIMSVRGVTVPIYATSSEKEVAYIIKDANIRILFVGDQDQYDIAANLFKKDHQIKLIVRLKDSIKPGKGVKCVFLEEWISGKPDNEIEKLKNTRYKDAKLDDLACIIYTSGTTGEPKGVMLDHANFADTIKAHDLELNLSDTETSLCFLPLTHVFEHNWSLVCLHNGIAVYFNEQPRLIADVIKEVRPHYMCAVPRFFEKVYGAVQETRSKTKGIKAKLFDWSISVGDDYYNEHLRWDKKAPAGLKFKQNIAGKLVHQKIRAGLGGRIKMMPCGGAPIDAKIVRFFHSVGLNVKVGYGLTESMATVTLYPNKEYVFESVGRPITGTKVKIGFNNEILVKGPGVMKGYYKKPEQTAETFEGEWLKTGDAGRLDDKGNLYITDRIKDLMKTSGGKYIAPQKLETHLINDIFIEQIAVIGDQRKFVSALMVPNFEALKQFAEENQIRFSNYEELVKNSKVVEMFKKRFEQLQKNFSEYEKIKKFTLLPKEFTMDAGELTATLKIKRKVIQKKYKELIDRMYNAVSDKNSDKEKKQ